MRAFAIVLATIFTVLVACTVGQGDVVYLNTGGVVTSNPVTFKANDIQVREILDKVLTPRNLRWRTRDDGIVVENE